MTLGLWLAVGGVIIVWLVYRAGQWSERQGVLRGLEAELEMHGNWVGTAYSEKDRGRWREPDYMVYKLATVAVDNAIAKGPGLFLNNDLTVSLIRYRQVISHLNQLIDKTTNFQIAADIWRTPRPADEVRAAIQLIESVHIQGIGGMDLSQRAGAHAFFKLVNDQLRRETSAPAYSVIWALSGLNLSFVKGWSEPLLRRGQHAWRLTADFGRRIVKVVSRQKAPRRSDASNKPTEQPPTG